MTDRQTLVCPRCGNADVVFREIDADGTSTVACSACPEMWPLACPSPALLPELIRLGGQLENCRHKAEIRRGLGHQVTAVLWDGRALRKSLEIRDLLESVAA